MSSKWDFAVSKEIVRKYVYKSKLSWIKQNRIRLGRRLIIFRCKRRHLNLKWVFLGLLRLFYSNDLFKKAKICSRKISVGPDLRLLSEPCARRFEYRSFVLERTLKCDWAIHCINGGERMISKKYEAIPVE